MASAHLALFSLFKYD